MSRELPNCMRPAHRGARSSERSASVCENGAARACRAWQNPVNFDARKSFIVSGAVGVLDARQIHQVLPRRRGLERSPRSATMNTADGAGAFSEMRRSWNYSFKELRSEVFFGDFLLRKATSF